MLWYKSWLETRWRFLIGIARIERQGRVMTVLCTAGADAVVCEARALGPMSVDVTPVSLKEIFLETVSAVEE